MSDYWIAFIVVMGVSNLVGVGVIWYLKREQKGHNHQHGHGQLAAEHMTVTKLDLTRHLSDPVVLANALQTAHAHLHFLTDAAQALLGDLRRRGIIREP